MDWLLLEPYYDGSHRALVDALRTRVVPDAALWALPARKWKWRMRGAALEFARRLHEEAPDVGAVFTSSMLNAAELKALAPGFFAKRPLVVYFHENQLAYPVQHFDKRDHHFAWTNALSALTADRLIFNSEFNRDSMLAGLESIVRKMPEARPQWALAAIVERAEVLPVPIDTDAISVALRGAPPRTGACHLVWNHRWEFDKGPDRLLQIVRALTDSGLDFELSVLGQAFRETPPVFEQIRAAAGRRLRHWGYVADRTQYLRLLASADVALSTALHEFQGLATLEAAACGAVPLVPDDLAYREIWPPEWRRAPDELAVAAIDRVQRVADYRRADAAALAAAYGWPALHRRWAAVFGG